jgi:acid phosphatase type 7
MNIFIYLFTFIFNMWLCYSQNNPNQVHIALAGKNDKGLVNTMAISWSTINDTQQHLVKYGFHSGDYTLYSNGYSQQYYNTYHHHVILTPTLQPNTRYYYIVGDEKGGYSKEFTFLSPNNHEDEPVTFLVYGDLGVWYSYDTMSYIQKEVDNENIDLIVHSGDIGYADDSFLHNGCRIKSCYESTWDTYMNLVEEWASKVPYMTAPGNHEADCHDTECIYNKKQGAKLSNFTAYNTRFRMPSKECGSNALNMHYSFNYKNIHFIAIDSETGYPNAPLEHKYYYPCGGFQEQLTWLENDLISANVNRNEQPWIFVYGHRPIYQGNNTDVNLQAAMEDLFYKYKVDIYFIGHVHSYERTWPTYQGKVLSTDPTTAYINPLSTIYLILGGAGNDEMSDANIPELNRVNDPTEYFQYKNWSNGDYGPWSASVDLHHFGIGKVNVLNSTTLLFDYIQTSTQNVYDSIIIQKIV